MTEPANESPRCARWVALSDRDALGEKLAPNEARFLRAHPRTCAACRAQAEVWEAMESMIDDPPEMREPSERPPAPEPVLEPAREVAPRRIGRWVAVAGLAAAAVAALVVHRAATERTPAPRTVAPSASVALPASSRAGASLEGANGQVLVDGHPAAAGQSLLPGATLEAREGTACLRIEPAVRACLARGGVVRVVELGNDRRLALTRGRIAAELDPQPAGTSFGVTTRDGSSIAVGTAFSVEVPDDGAPVVTRVSHGTVLVRTHAGREQRVTAHQMSSMSQDAPLPVPNAEEEDRDRALLSLAPAPVTTALVAAPSAGVPVVAPSTKASSAALGQSPRELLAAARERRTRGDVAGAASAYRELLARHGESPEATAALVAFGELQLGELADPSGALATFDRYLARGGALDEEASFGRIRAYRALGRARAERDAIDTFLARFPGSALTTTLEARRGAIEIK